jgi:hypothetical protein
MKRCKSIVTAVCLSCFGIGVNAEPIYPQLFAKHTFIVGGYRQSVDGELYAQRDGGTKRTIDLGNLDLDNSDSTYTVEYRYRLNDQWLFSVGTYQFESNGKGATSKEFEYDGVTFEAGARLDTGLEIDTYMVEALYSVYKTDRAEILLGGGLHMFDFSASIKAKVSVGDQERTGEQGSDDILAPLPNLRAQGYYAITPKWALTGAVGWLSLNYGDYDGAFTYLSARTIYQFTERFGAGVGYQLVDVDLGYDGGRGDSGFDIEFTGPSAFLTYSF